MTATFQCLIATIGRPELQRMLNSLLPQLNEHDCVTIVFDGHSTIPEFDLTLAKCKINQYCEPEALGYWGHAIRNKYAYIIEQRDYVMHADDDDIYTEGTFDYLREHCIDKSILYVGLMARNDGIAFAGFEMKRKRMGTPNGIIPFDYNSEAEWAHIVEGDGMFYEILDSKHPGSVQFLDRIIYIIRP